MAIADSTEGSDTITGWKRRARAASDSMYLRYSLVVVAPQQCSSPRARAGFSMLDASIEPSAAPKPKMVWISSMKRMTFPSVSSTSFKRAFNLSSNSPRNFAPATKEAKSKDFTCLFWMESGTSPLIMRWAKPSAMAVLPTPGCPIKMGLFLVLRDKTWMVRRISSSRPMTGSSLPFAASSVKSVVNLSRFSPSFTFFLWPLVSPDVLENVRAHCTVNEDLEWL
eukprot:Lithocolla_globosa_v1_NODE_1634_length_2432_cov_41.369794.p2 type:complete len:224 gc:universal NODE_1634_length_2432_cov_41.369794:777-106(-)